MQILSYLSNFIMPLLIFYVIATAAVKRLDVYSIFLEGVKEGFHIVIDLLPTLIALLVSVGVFRASGIFDVIFQGMEKLLGFLMNDNGALVLGSFSMPLSVLPVFIIRLFSSSAANGLLLDIFKEYGADSLEGVMSAISLSCTEAVLYCLSIYFASVGITKVRWTLSGALLATLAGVVAAVVLANLIC